MPQSREADGAARARTGEYGDAAAAEILLDARGDGRRAGARHGSILRWARQDLRDFAGAEAAYEECSSKSPIMRKPRSISASFRQEAGNVDGAMDAYRIAYRLRP